MPQKNRDHVQNRVAFFNKYKKKHTHYAKVRIYLVGWCQNTKNKK